MVTNRIVPSAHIIHLFSEERNIFLFLVDKAQSLVYCIHIRKAQNDSGSVRVTQRRDEMAIWVVEEREKGSRKIWRPSMSGYVNPTKVIGEQDLQDIQYDRLAYRVCLRKP